MHLFTLLTMRCIAKGVKAACLVNKHKAHALITDYECHDDDDGHIVLKDPIANMLDV